MICEVSSSFFGLGLEDGHVPTVWLLLDCTGELQAHPGKEEALPSES